MNTIVAPEITAPKRRAYSNIENSPFEDAMREMGIQPFCKKSVDEYKARRLHDLWNPPKPRFRRLGAVLMLTVAALLVGAIYLAATMPDPQMTIGFIALSIGISVMLEGLIVTNLIVATPAKLGAAWKEVDLADVGSKKVKVPKKVKAEAQFLSKVPGAKPVVEYLDEDPLLRFDYRKHPNSAAEVHYTHCWNEKGLVP